MAAGQPAQRARGVMAVCIAAGSSTPAFGGSPGAFSALSPASQGAFGGGLFGGAAQPQQQPQVQTQMAPGSFSGSPLLQALADDKPTNSQPLGR